MIQIIEKKDHVDIISMKNDFLEIIVSNYGCTILNIFMKDKHGHLDDIVLGYQDIETYGQKDTYFGAIVGRVANRIRHGSFHLNGHEYQLAINNGPNHLHGGIHGFSYQVFDYQIVNDTTLEFSYLSKDKEEGYPGNLHLKVRYELKQDTLKIHYYAECDQDTLINITNHSYFNLSGHQESILHHQLKIKADHFACIDQNGCPTGEFRKVVNTPFDFSKESEIGPHLLQKDDQLELGHGFDHPFIFNDNHNQVQLYHEASGRRLTVSTSLPGAQIYTANYLDGSIGKDGKPYCKQDAICIETQNLPDAIHLEKNPTTLLRKNEKYDEVTSYKFEVIK
ncbi:MAG: aldose epimerase family protein [Traorella sp.]